MVCVIMNGSVKTTKTSYPCSSCVANDVILQ